MKNPASKELRYLALGDSYTIGESVTPLKRFPVLLTEALKNRGILMAPPEIIATTGWTTADLKTGIGQANIVGNSYDLVSLLIGVNNYYQGRGLGEYKQEFEELLLRAITFAGGSKEKVIVLSIPDYGYTPLGQQDQAAISEGIDLFNQANQEISDSIGVKYFNITPVSRKGLADPDLVASDNLHPSGKQYQLWVDLMVADVAQLINTP